MQLKITSDYAVRIVLHLCTNNISATSKEIASVMCIPEEDIEYIVDWLIDGNIIKEGEDGKLYLAKPKDSITLQDVFNAVGENTIINKCLEKDKCCSRHAIENCPAHRFYSSLQDKIDLEFDTSISGLLSLEEYDNADIVNSIEERVYIIDNITHEILFINESAKQAYKGNYRNKKCYEVIFERTTPCPECDSIKCDYQTAHIRQLDTDDECLTVKSKIIPFRGREAYLTVTFDITSSQRQKKELERALLAENLLTDCIRCLQGSSDLSLAINDILAMIGQFTQADRSYISTIDGRVTTNKYEWCAQGVIPQIDNFQNLDIKAISRWFDFFANRQCVVVPNVDAIQSSYSPEYELMVNKGVHNYIVAPLYLENKLFGYLGMDNPPIEKSKNIVSLLMALTYFITASIQAYNDKKLLEKLSYVDSMSGLKNRNAYILDIDNYKNNKENQKVGVVYIDINRLKEINDNFGHLSGDKTIVTTAKCISRIFCEYNVYRTGGDEFVIICYDIEEKEFSTKVEELLALFEEVKISVSLGKQWLLKCADINSLIALADQQMYSAKKDTYIKNKESHR